MAAVLATSGKHELEAPWHPALMTGMRRGELLGLKWEDIDLDRGVLSVRRTRSRGTGNTWEVGTPKTASGQRAITLPAAVVASLKRHRARQLSERLRLGPLREDTGFVFTGEFGQPLHVNSLSHRYEALIRAARAPCVRFHDLRHTSATFLLAKGMHSKIVQERPGPPASA